MRKRTKIIIGVMASILSVVVITAVVLVAMAFDYVNKVVRVEPKQLEGPIEVGVEYSVDDFFEYDRADETCEKTMRVGWEDGSLTGITVTGEHTFVIDEVSESLGANPVLVVTTVASNSDSPEDGSGMVRIMFPTSLD